MSKNIMKFLSLSVKVMQKLTMFKLMEDYVSEIQIHSIETTEM